MISRQHTIRISRLGLCLLQYYLMETRINEVRHGTSQGLGGKPSMGTADILGPTQ